MFKLSQLGFSEFFQQQLQPGERAARVSGVFGSECELVESKRFRVPGADVAVGDWVVTDGERIRRVLERRSLLVRKASGRSSASQALAANVDLVWIVTAVGPDLSLARIERYLALAWDGGAKPIVVVNKIDRGDPEGLEELEGVVDVHLVSAVRSDGLDDLFATVAAGQTMVMVGSSGVGKSTLLNRIAERSIADTGAVRTQDDKGRHTTTRRDLFVVEGRIVIDTPGLREVGLAPGREGVERVFEEISELAAGCRYRDCAHGGEPGCAVAEGVAPERLARYRALLDERARAAVRADVAAQRKAGKKFKKMVNEVMAFKKMQRGE